MLLKYPTYLLVCPWPTFAEIPFSCEKGWLEYENRIANIRRLRAVGFCGSRIRLIVICTRSQYSLNLTAYFALIDGNLTLDQMVMDFGWMLASLGLMLVLGANWLLPMMHRVR